ncbi:MAG: O-antigen ligase family protein [Bacillota bacterium]
MITSLTKKENIKKGLDIKKSYFMTFILFLLVYPPFFRGLFFEEEQLITHFLWGIALIAFLYLNRDEKKLEISYLDIAVFVFSGLYFINIFRGANTWFSIKEFLNIFNLLIVYFIISRINTDNQIQKIILKYLFMACVGVAIIGVVASLNMPIYDSAFDGDRIASTFQYPNALASYLLAFLIYGIHLLTNAADEKQRAFYSFSNLIITIAFIGTKSRGGLLVAVFIMLVYLLITNNKVKTISIAAVNFIFAVPLSIAVLYLSRMQNTILGSLVLILGLTLFLYINKRFYHYVYNQKSLTYIGLVIVVLAGFLIYAGNIDIINRFADIKLSDINVIARFDFYKDGLTMIKDEPLLGFGGGGWQAAYKNYRSLPYFTSEIHNHLLQVGIETGLLGVLTFLIICIFTLYFLFKGDEVTKLIGLIILTFIIHNLIDFSFSLMAYSIVFWVMIGLAASYIRNKRVYVKYNFLKYTLMLIILMFTTSSLIFSMAALAVANGKNENNKGNLAQAYKELKLGVKLNPFNSDNSIDLAKINYVLYQREKDEEYIKNSINLVESAIKHDRYKPEWYSAKAMYLVYSGQIDKEPYEALQRSIEIDPYGSARYIDASRLLLNMARLSIKNEKDIEKAKIYLKEITDLWQKASKYSKITMKYSWRTPKPNETGEFLQYVASAYILQGNYEQGKVIWEKAKKASEGENLLKWPEPILYSIDSSKLDEQTKSQVEEVKSLIELLNN